jgi:hypothetical protein
MSTSPRDWFADGELFDWLLGIQLRHPRWPGKFLNAIGSAARQASPAQYAIIRPALLELKREHPEFSRPPIEPTKSKPASE